MAQNVEGIIAHGDAVGLTDPLLLGGTDEGGLIKRIRTDVDGRVIIILNTQAMPASPTQGPATTTLTNGANVTLVAAPGAGKAIVVTTIQQSADATGQAITVNYKEGTGGTPRLKLSMKEDGIYPPFVMEPGWKLAENTALVAQRIEGNKDVVLNYHFYVEAV